MPFGLTIPEARDGLDGRGKLEVVNGLPVAIQLVEGRHELAKKLSDLSLNDAADNSLDGARKLGVRKCVGNSLEVMVES